MLPALNSKRFYLATILLVIIIIIGIIGFWFIGEGKYSFIDSFYMTFITITTIGFGEIIDMSGNTFGRVFTIIIALGGMGVLLYFISNITAMIVEGNLTESFRRRKMVKMANNAKNHYIVCGVGRIGVSVIDELKAVNAPFVVVEVNPDQISHLTVAFHDAIYIQGDATSNNTLIKAGIKNAAGLFAVIGNDNENLVLCLTAKQLNPNLRVVARCNDTQNIEKMNHVGADAVVSPNQIGGLRMASEMIRPTVVSFLDVMLRDKNKNLRIEEIPVDERWVGHSLEALNLERFKDVLLLAVKNKLDWTYHPPKSFILGPGNILIIMTTSPAKEQLTHALSQDKVNS